jgi:hypothetical protein
MNSMKKFTYLLLTVFIFLVITAATVVVQEFSADIPDTSKNEIHLKWIVMENEGVMHYTIKRKMVRDVDFILVNTIESSSMGANPRQYEYIDKNVFRNNSNTEPVLYELYVTTTNGNQTLIGQTEVNYSSTAIRRTWGSIKAMFQ